MEGSRSPGYATMASRAYSQLEELIVTLQLPPGMVLSEHILANKLEHFL